MVLLETGIAIDPPQASGCLGGCDGLALRLVLQEEAGTAERDHSPLLTAATSNWTTAI
jgi:hypothetical protein